MAEDRLQTAATQHPGGGRERPEVRCGRRSSVTPCSRCQDHAKTRRLWRLSPEALLCCALSGGVRREPQCPAEFWTAGMGELPGKTGVHILSCLRDDEEL